MMRAYAIRHGRVQNSGCEINVVDHCNLSCRACAHLSPVLRRHHVEVTSLARDLEILARHYHARWARLLGGEPLLHPDLIGVIAAVRESRISDRIAITTNGLLLPRMPDELWKALDGVEISSYPGKALSEKALSECRAKARTFDVDLRQIDIDLFRESYSEVGTDDGDLIQRIYNSCELVHTWRCHYIAEGYFYKCPPAYFLPRALSSCSPHAARDGLHIEDSVAFGTRLVAYLETRNPLLSCRNCLGSAGQGIPHSQVGRRDFREQQRRPTEELVDAAHLNSRRNLVRSRWRPRVEASPVAVGARLAFRRAAELTGLKTARRHRERL